MWSIWHIARHTPTRQHALTHVLGIIAGTSLIGVVLPAVLIGALDPFPIWLGYAVLAVGAAAVLGVALARVGTGRMAASPSLVITSCVLLAVLALAGVAVT